MSKKIHPFIATTIATTLAACGVLLGSLSVAAMAATEPAPPSTTITTTVSGRTVELKGIMAQRQSGMGWGQIAHAIGLKLGAVVSAAKRADKQDAVKHDTAHASLDDAGHAGGGGKGGADGHGGNGGGGGGGSKK